MFSYVGAAEVGKTTYLQHCNTAVLSLSQCCLCWGYPGLLSWPWGHHGDVIVMMSTCDGVTLMFSTKTAHSSSGMSSPTLTTMPRYPPSLANVTLPPSTSSRRLPCRRRRRRCRSIFHCWQFGQFSLSFYHFDKSIRAAVVFWILSVSHFWFSEWIHQLAGSSIQVTAGVWPASSATLHIFTKHFTETQLRSNVD